MSKQNKSLKNKKITYLTATKRIPCSQNSFKHRVWMNLGDLRRVGEDRYVALKRHTLNDDLELGLEIFSRRCHNADKYKRLWIPGTSTPWEVHGATTQTYGQILAIGKENNKPTAALVEFTIHCEEVSHVQCL